MHCDDTSAANAVPAEHRGAGRHLLEDNVRVERAKTGEYSDAMTTRRPLVGLADLAIDRVAVQELAA